MKLLRGAIILLAAILAAAYQAKATTYSDSTGDLFNNGFGHLDITSVEVNNNATDLIFKINLNGDPVATDWGKYMIAVDSVAGGDTTGNGWARPISMSSGMDYWVGNWADGGNGEQLFAYSGSWNMIKTWGNFAGPGGTTNFDAGYGVTKDTSSITITMQLADLGLAPGNTFQFDVYTSGGGGGDGAVDSLANPSQSIADWGIAYNSAVTDSYTVVPEPSTLLLVGLGGLALIGRIFRRRA